MSAVRGRSKRPCVNKGLLRHQNHRFVDCLTITEQLFLVRLAMTADGIREHIVGELVTIDTIDKDDTAKALSAVLTDGSFVVVCLKEGLCPSVSSDEKDLCETVFDFIQQMKRRIATVQEETYIRRTANLEYEAVIAEGANAAVAAFAATEAAATAATAAVVQIEGNAAVTVPT